MSVEPSTGTWKSSQCPRPQKRILFPPTINCPLTMSPQWGWSLKTICLFYSGILPGVFLCGDHSCPEIVSTLAISRALYSSMPCLPTLTFFLPPLLWLAWAFHGIGLIQKSYIWLSNIGCCLLCREDLIQSLKIVHVYGHQKKYLEGNLVAWPFSKITTAGSTVGPWHMSCWPWLRNQSSNSLLWNSPQIQSKSSLSPNNCHVTSRSRTPYLEAGLFCFVLLFLFFFLRL